MKTHHYENIVQKCIQLLKGSKESEGIVLIYSNYIDGGCVPMALALEEAGITRYGNTNSLFKTPPVSNFKVNGENAKYIMITGDKDYLQELKQNLRSY